jgi:cell division protein FtsB
MTLASPIVSLASAALSGGVVSWLATWLNEKSKSRAYTMGAVDSAVKTALESVTAEVDRLNGKIKQLEADQDACHARNRRLERELAELRQEVEARPPC